MKRILKFLDQQDDKARSNVKELELQQILGVGVDLKPSDSATLYIMKKKSHVAGTVLDSNQG